MILEEYLTKEEKEKVARLFPEDSLPDALLSILSDAIGKLPEPGEKSDSPLEDERFHGITVSDSPWLALTDAIHYGGNTDEGEAGEWLAVLGFRDIAGAIRYAKIPFRRIWERKATEDLFCRGFLPSVLGEYRPSTDSMRRIDDTLMRAIYDLRAEREKLKPCRIDWNKG